MNRTYEPYILTEGFCIIFALSILYHLRHSFAAEHKTRSLQRMIAAYIVMVAADMLWACSISGVFRSDGMAGALFNAVSIAAVVPGCYYWFAFVEERIRPERTFSPKVRLLISLPAIIMCVIDLSSAFTGWVFYLDASGTSVAGKAFWLQGAVTYIYLIIPTVHSLIAAFRTSVWEKRREYLTYVAYMCGCFVVVEAMDYLNTTPLLELAIFAAILILFLSLYLDREHELAKQEREFTESRSAVMLSQIQPHFLYNTLCAIQAMCLDDPPEAARTTAEFADYLRGNLDSLSRKAPVPFEQELRHTQLYLTLEQKRYGDRLQVEYDIGPTAFMLPALTLQPVAENAVKHGVSVLEDGGTVRIATGETAHSFTITVTDDGVGFDVAAVINDARTHIGIKNVRDRLAAICGGTLSIESAPGAGTTAVITLPKEAWAQ